MRLLARTARKVGKHWLQSALERTGEHCLNRLDPLRQLKRRLLLLLLLLCCLTAKQVRR